MEKVKCAVCRFKRKKDESASYGDKHICKPCEMSMRSEGYTEIDKYNKYLAEAHPVVTWMRSFLK